MSHTTVLLLALLFANFGTAVPRGIHARFRNNHHTIAALRDARLEGPEELLHRAAKVDILGRNWPQLVHKLHRQPNSTVKIVTLGGRLSPWAIS
jgi:hypothetical protein